MMQLLLLFRTPMTEAKDDADVEGSATPIKIQFNRRESERVVAARLISYGHYSEAEKKESWIDLKRLSAEDSSQKLFCTNMEPLQAMGGEAFMQALQPPVKAASVGSTVASQTNTGL
eukprot:gnl/Hemi2/3397_TR1186_c0_g6_i1.p2 gnl/Hemi2/3397_TR1186_c0_g6~~gnl/Hemi2/3397_TR1186_c0_g6_i1.p2  ORF type:complete len:117 (-),score=4.72 gnl/Hemi2/3397_TR1186_c0_g6_i1:46-396(-)